MNINYTLPLKKIGEEVSVDAKKTRWKIYYYITENNREWRRAYKIVLAETRAQAIKRTDIWEGLIYDMHTI